MALPTHFKLAAFWVCFWCGFASSLPLTPELKQQIKDAARRASLDPRLVEAVVQVESNNDKNATSHKGARGLMQVIQPTADECGISDAYHATNNLMGACECLRKLINNYQGDLTLALAAYNAGPGAVAKYNGIPPYKETQAYVKKILRLYNEKRRVRG